jgi:beta-galactosidase
LFDERTHLRERRAKDDQVSAIDRLAQIARGEIHGAEFSAFNHACRTPNVTGDLACQLPFPDGQPERSAKQTDTYDCDFPKTHETIKKEKGNGKKEKGGSLTADGRRWTRMGNGISTRISRINTNSFRQSVAGAKCVQTPQGTRSRDSNLPCQAGGRRSKICVHLRSSAVKNFRASAVSSTFSFFLFPFPLQMEPGMNLKRLFFFALALVFPRLVFCAPAHTFNIGTNDFLLDGQRFQIRCGEVHAARVPPEYWRHRLQMAKAMGLNTVCAYLFWNLHEPRPGEFNWKGDANVAEFCRIAQQEGLWVILRPGPYACAEWEMGGFPWWLLKHDDIKLRTRDPRYLEAVRRYLKEVGRVLGPQQITHGGPILMVQVENEYGFYGKDAAYMGDVRQALLDAGFDVPLFACNPADHLRDGYRADLFPVVNFGSDPATNFLRLRTVLTNGPLMCGEFYPGWFDTWGAPHHTGKTQRYLTDLEYMLKTGASFSIYMAHGGTTFGFGTGADRPFKPDTSSYDYDAPISEAGWATEKFFKTRELFAKYLLPGEKIPDPPAKNPVITIAPVEVKEFASLFTHMPPFDRSPAAIYDHTPGNFEKYDQDYGLMCYRTRVPGEGVVEVSGVHDIGYVYSGQAATRRGFLDRRNRSFKLEIPANNFGNGSGPLWIFVEAMGRVNFGTEVHDHKGLIGPVKYIRAASTNLMTDWSILKYPLDEKMLAGLEYDSPGPYGPTFYRATIEIDEPGDTFLDMRPWGKGFAWVNGHNLGRYWNIGPQQTMYVPGPWLKRGKNEFVILDLLGPEKPVIAALDKPILDQLRPELDFSKMKRPAVTLKLDPTAPTHRGSFSRGTELQEVKFAQPAKGRYFCLESLNAHDGKPFAAVAELDLLDESGNPLSHDGWLIASVDSEERVQDDGTAENAIDGQTANYWLSESTATQPNHPHRLVLDLGQTFTISGFRYVPRQGNNSTTGRIKDYRVYVGDGLVQK